MGPLRTFYLVIEAPRQAPASPVEITETQSRIKSVYQCFSDPGISRLMPSESRPTSRAARQTASQNSAAIAS